MGAEHHPGCLSKDVYVERKQSIFRACFEYDPETGVVRWKMRPRNHFKTEGAHKIFNARNGGREAGCAFLPSGPRYVQVFGSLVRLHRVIWIMVFGAEPEVVRHRNGDMLDNRLENLEASTRILEHRYRRVAKNNTSGVTGVVWRDKPKKWEANIHSAGKFISLGYFKVFDDVVKARKEAEEKYWGGD